MLLPPLCTQNQYVSYAKQAGLDIFAEPLDISKQVSKTWCVSQFKSHHPFHPRLQLDSIIFANKRTSQFPLTCSRDISVSLVADPSLWALALTQGRDFISFLRAFQAMRKGYANGSFRYAVMVFEKRVAKEA